LEHYRYMALKTSTSRKRSAEKATRAKTATARHTAGRAKVPSAERQLFSVVGIGASAGGLEAFTQLLGALPLDTGLAFVLVQHLDPKHESMLTALLSHATPLPIREARDGMRVEANHIYVIPPNTNLALLHSRLCLMPRTETRGQHLPVDFFLRSLPPTRRPAPLASFFPGRLRTAPWDCARSRPKAG
jgi:two-component system CheB/CheR fusion protein